MPSFLDRRRVRVRVRHLVLAAAAVVVTVVVAGCGAVAPVETFAAREASTSALTACASSAATLCHHASACTPRWFGRFFDDEKTCTAVFNERCLDRYRGPGASAEIADCSAAIDALSCDALIDPIIVTYLDPLFLIDSCPVTPGMFAAGDQCLREGDCATGHCAWHNGCGTCAAPVAPPTFLALGEACTTSQQCASRACGAAGSCIATAKVGESCADRPCDLLDFATCGSDLVCRPFATVPLGGHCSWSDWCDVGLTCAGADTGSGTCRPDSRAGLGGDCSTGFCTSELSCIFGKCVVPRSVRDACVTSTPASTSPR